MEDPTGSLMRLKRSASSDGKPLEGTAIAQRILGMSLYEMADGMGTMRTMQVEVLILSSYVSCYV